MPEKDKKPTIAMLLDIDHLYGNHESRLGPIIMSLLIGGAPLLFYVYFGIFNYIPVWIFAPIEVIVIIRTVMIIPGREGHRLRIFRRQLYDDYSAAAQFMNIKTIHPDGCIEFTNGKIMYLVCCFNGTCDDEVRHSIALHKLLNSLIGTYEFDIYIHNIVVSPELRDYYNKVKRFNKNDSARNFIKIIDYTLSLTQNTSLVQCTIYAIKGRRGDWKDMSQQIRLACKSRSSKVYKTIYPVNNTREINDILNRDIDTTVQTQELLRSKYTTEEFGTSRVLAYDLPDDMEVVQGKKAIKPIIPEQTKSTFHTTIDIKEILNEDQ